MNCAKPSCVVVTAILVVLLFADLRVKTEELPISVKDSSLKEHAVRPPTAEVPLVGVKEGECRCSCPWCDRSGNQTFKAENECNNYCEEQCGDMCGSENDCYSADFRCSTVEGQLQY